MVKDVTHEKDQFSIASNPDKIEITNSSSPSVIGNITPVVLFINCLFLIYSFFFNNQVYFLVSAGITLLYYFIGPYVNPAIFQSFKTIIKLKQLESMYSDKNKGSLKNIEEAEIVKQTVTKSISAKARITNPKVGGKSPAVKI